jgi:hypothetical protein
MITQHGCVIISCHDSVVVTTNLKSAFQLLSELGRVRCMYFSMLSYTISYQVHTSPDMVLEHICIRPDSDGLYEIVLNGRNF